MKKLYNWKLFLESINNDDEFNQSIERLKKINYLRPIPCFSN